MKHKKLYIYFLLFIAISMGMLLWGQYCLLKIDFIEKKEEKLQEIKKEIIVKPIETPVVENKTEIRDEEVVKKKVEPKVILGKNNRYKIQIHSEPINLKLSEFFLYDQNDKTVLLDKFYGSTIIMHFWASWCTSCSSELKQLQKLQKLYSNSKIKIIAVSEDYKGINFIKEFYKNRNITDLDIYLDKQNKLFQDMKVIAIPSTIIINEHGREVIRVTGEIDWLDAKNSEPFSLFLPSIY